NPPVVISAPKPDTPPAEQVILTTPDPSSLPPGQVVMAVSETRVAISSPLPPPELLAEYNKIIPNAGERLLVMVEQESKHRRTLENTRLQAEIEDQRAQRWEIKRGQLCALTIGLAAIVGGTVAVCLGFQWGGGALGTAGVAGLVWAFLKKQSDA